MTSVLTMVALGLLFLIIALPGVAAIARPKTAVFAAPFYLVLLAGVLTYHVGFSFGGRLPTVPATADGPNSLCEQAVDQAERGGLILNRTDPNRVSVRGDLWTQLPEQAQAGMTRCLEQMRPAGTEGPVTIVRSGPA